MQNRYLTGEEKNPKTKEEMKEVNGGIVSGFGEVVTCINGPVVTYAFPDPLVAAYRNSVAHVSLISALDGSALDADRKN